MSERTRHTKTIPFPITKLTCSKQHEKVVSTTAKAVTLKQKREKSWQLKTSHNTTQNNTIMAEKRKPRWRIFKTLNESKTPNRENTIKQRPPWIPKETLNRWKELALFCSRNLGGWWIGGGISMTSGSMVLPEGSILWLFVPQQERRNKAKEKSEFEGRVNVHAGVILLCRNEKERESVWKLKIEERETKTKRETLVSVALIDRLMKRKFKKTLALLL